MNDKKMILIVSDGEKTTAMINGKVVSDARELVFRAKWGDVSLNITGTTTESFDHYSEEDFWNQVSRIMGYDAPCKGKSFFESVERYKDKMERARDRDAVLTFHEKLRNHCNAIQMKCDSGKNPDCPFVEYCYRCAAELSDESIGEAFDLLNQKVESQRET